MDSIKVSGMSCQHCVASVTKALEDISGLEEVSVDLDAGKATFANKGVDRETIKAAISGIGFDPGE